jgi:hypothetical protein
MYSIVETEEEAIMITKDKRVICDNGCCGKTCAFADIKEFVNRKIDKEWYNFCSQECFEDYYQKFKEGKSGTKIKKVSGKKNKIQSKKVSTPIDTLFMFTQEGILIPWDAVGRFKDIIKLISDKVDCPF